jgi:AraC-like DNA-binding protein
LSKQNRSGPDDIGQHDAKSADRANLPSAGMSESQIGVVVKMTDLADGFCHRQSALSHGKFFYVSRGLVTAEYDAGISIVPPGRAIWLPSAIAHTLCTQGITRLFTVEVPYASLPPQPAGERVVDVSALLHELLREAVHIAGPRPAPLRDARLLDLVLDEISVMPATSLSLPLPQNEYLRRICLSLMNDPGSKISISDWRREAGIGSSSLQQLFVTETGLTFDGWRREARLLNAVQRLVRGDRIFEIAAASAYTAHSSFAASFKRRFGEQPSKFQEACRKRICRD